MAGLIHAFGGRSFLGLGCILTGAKTYDELMALAEKGSNLNLDFTLVDIFAKQEGVKEGSEADDLYGGFKDSVPPQPIFLWGKCVGQNLDQYKKEDVARTLLHMVCTNLVQICLYNAMMSRISHIFVGGSFVGHPLTQKIVFEEFESQRCWAASQIKDQNGDYHLHVMHYGSHLGSLGAMIMGIEQEAKSEK